MVEAFFYGLLETGEAPIPFGEIYAVTKAAFDVLESIRQGGKQIII